MHSGAGGRTACCSACCLVLHVHVGFHFSVSAPFYFGEGKEHLGEVLWWNCNCCSDTSHEHLLSHVHSAPGTHRAQFLWCKTKLLWVAVSQKPCALRCKLQSAAEIVWKMDSWKLPEENLASCPREKHSAPISSLPGVFWGTWAQNKLWQVTREELEMAVTCSSRWMLAASRLCLLVLFLSLDASFCYSFGLSAVQWPVTKCLTCVLHSLHVFCLSTWCFNSLIPHGLWLILEDLAQNLLSTNHQLRFAAMCTHKHFSLFLGFLMPQICQLRVHCYSLLGLGCQVLSIHSCACLWHLGR